MRMISREGGFTVAMKYATIGRHHQYALLRLTTHLAAGASAACRIEANRHFRQRERSAIPRHTVTLNADHRLELRYRCLTDADRSALAAVALATLHHLGICFSQERAWAVPPGACRCCGALIRRFLPMQPIHDADRAAAAHAAARLQDVAQFAHMPEVDSSVSIASALRKE